MARLIRSVAKSVASNEKAEAEITVDKARKILGVSHYQKDIYQGNDIAGVVTGLAWTAFGGDILFIGSIAQASNVKAPISYSYSKRAINIFARHQALRLAAKKIAVNVVNPGHVMTEDGIWGKRKKESPIIYNEFISNNIPTGVICEVENVAELVFSLTNKKLSGMLTGENINIDGGTTINF